MKDRNKISTKILALLMVLIVLALSVVPAMAATDSYNFANAGSDATNVIDSTEILEDYIGKDLSEAERRFLESYSTIALKYNPVINTNKITLTYGSGKLTVKAKKYTYTAENGKTFEWIPDTAEAGGVVKSFTESDDAYVAVFETESSADAKVNYKAQTKISASDMDLILNLHYYTAKYASDMADYQEKQAAYEKYLYEKRLYDDALAKYNRYLADYEEYKELKRRFENYDELMAQYEIDKAKYDAYLESLETKEEDIKKYEAYVAKLEKIKKQLSAFELVYVKMKDKRQIYSAVNGGTVDQVLESVGSIIKKLGKDYKNTVEIAEEATKSLRELMTKYRKCKTEEEKYNYYVSNYSKICDSVYKLAWSLEKLYDAPGVTAALKGSGKHEKYVILVAQLVLTSNALIDGKVTTPDGSVTYDSKWKMDKRTCYEILGKVQYFDDDDSSSPLTGGYPTEVQNPNIEVVEKPNVPEKLTSKPIEPKKVENPGSAPEKVKAPTAPNAEVSAAKDVYYELDSKSINNLIDALSKGEIVKRTTPTSSKKINLKTFVVKKYDSESVTLTFDVPANPVGSTAYKHKIIVDKDSAVVYDGKIPATYVTPEGTYKFAGWMSSEGQVDLSLGFAEDVTLTPVYTRLPIYYDVTWSVNGETIVESHISGEIPNPTFVPTKPDSGDYCYRFVGWDRELEILTENTTYIAKFEAVYIASTSTGGATIRVEEGNMICDVSHLLNGKVDISMLIPRVKGKYSLTVLTSAGSIDFTFTDVILMSELGVTGVMLNVRSDSTNYTDSSFTLYGSDNTEVKSASISADIRIKHRLSDTKDTVLKNGDEYNKFTLDESDLSYRAKNGVNYKLIKEYSIIVVKSAFADIKVDREVAYSGDTVSFEIEAKPGVKLINGGISITDREGNNVAFNRTDKTVKITDRDIVISVKAKYILYNVVFVANGMVISEQELTYGSEPRLPASPTIASDGEYDYTFVGWSPSITPVTCDITYEAQFDKTPITVSETETPKETPEEIIKYVETAFIGIGVLVFCIISVVTFLIIRRIRKDKRLSKRKKLKEQGVNSKNEPVSNTVGKSGVNKKSDT